MMINDNHKRSFQLCMINTTTITIFIFATTLINSVESIQTQVKFQTAELLRKDFLQLDRLYEDSLLPTSFPSDATCLSSKSDLPACASTENQNNFQPMNITSIQKQIFYETTSKTLSEDGSTLTIIATINKYVDFYMNVYNNFIRCIRITLSTRDDHFLDLKIEDLSRDRFEYYNPDFELKPPQTQPKNQSQPANGKSTRSTIQFNSFDLQISNINEPLLLSITSKSSKALLIQLDSSLIMSDKYIHLKYPASSKHVFGLGERNYKFNLEFNDSTYTIWNRDSPKDLETASPEGGHNTYGSHPVYLMKDTPINTKHDSLSETPSNFHLVYLQNVNAMDVILTKQQEIIFHITGGILDFKIITCESPNSCIKRYHDFIGKQALMPFWAYGFHQSRWGYKNLSTVNEVIQNYTRAEFPLESVFLDIDYMISSNTFTVNTTQFPLVNSTIRDSIDDSGKRIVLIQDVAIGLENRTLDVRSDALSLDISIKNIDENVYIGRVWPGYTLFPDFEKPITQIFWQNYTRNFMNQYNISAFWLDMNEFANFCHGICEELYGTYRIEHTQDSELYNSGLPYFPGNRTLEKMSLSIVSIHPTSQNLEFNFHNLNGLIHAQINYDTIQYEMKNPLPFLITRSTIPGTGKYASHWAGDNNSTFEFLQKSISSLFNFHIFGIDFTGSDICGFMGNTTLQLCNRWAQLGSIYPFSRNHNHEGQLDQEFYQFSNFQGALESFQLKYSLLKYYYTLSLNNTYQTKPAFMNFPNEPHLYSEQFIENHIMISDHLLIVPVVHEDQSTTQVFFPSTNTRWYNLTDGQMYQNSNRESITIHNSFTQSIDIFLREGYLIYRQLERVLSSSELSNKFDLVCGLGAPSSSKISKCVGIMQSVNDFSEINIHSKCTFPFTCLYKTELIFDHSLQSFTLSFTFLDSISYNPPQIIFIRSISLFSPDLAFPSTPSQKPNIFVSHTSQILLLNSFYKKSFKTQIIGKKQGIKLTANLKIQNEPTFVFTL